MELVLIGGGHAHVHVLRELGENAVHGRMVRREVELAKLKVTLIAKDAMTPYSGMLPGYVSGAYTHDQIHLDLRHLCRCAGVRFVHASAERITYSNSGENNNNNGGRCRQRR